MDGCSRGCVAAAGGAGGGLSARDRASSVVRVPCLRVPCPFLLCRRADCHRPPLRVPPAVGYRHIDCATIYGNEKTVGEGLKDFIAEVSGAGCEGGSLTCGYGVAPCGRTGPRCGGGCAASTQRGRLGGASRGCLAAHRPAGPARRAVHSQQGVAGRAPP